MRHRTVVLVAIFLASAGWASAYQCKMLREFQKERKRATVIFVGKIWDIAKAEPVGRLIGGPIASFEVSRVFKGKPGKRISIYLNSIGGEGYGFCNVHLKVGEEYLVYAAGKPLSTEVQTRGVTVCDRTRGVKDAADDLALLGRSP